MANEANEPIGNIPSPCVRNCCLDENDICIGCFRSLSEIVHWSQASEYEKKETLARCCLRSKQRDEI
ncbi:MAG: DUF1289 domain-containing protein [Pseudomonadota bacterium]